MIQESEKVEKNYSKHPQCPLVGSRRPKSQSLEANKKQLNIKTTGMKTQINLSKISFIEILLQFIFMFLLINSILFSFTIFEGKPRFYIYPASWISQLIFPIAYSVIQNIINRNGVLTICNYDDIPELKEKMKLIIDKKKN